MNLIDVAKVAKVSPGTVSRVVNGHSSVSAETARRVREALAQVGYQQKAVRPGRIPHRAAALRRAQRTGLLGILLPGRQRALFNDPYMARFLEAMSEAAAECNRHLTIIEIPDTREMPNILRERKVEGVIPIGGSMPLPLTSETLGTIPFVLLDERPTSFPVDKVLTDHTAIAALAADYLLSYGCKNPAVVNHDPVHVNIARRVASFRDYLAGKGVGTTLWSSPPDNCPPPDTLWQSDKVCELSAPLLDRMLAAHPRPDSIFFPTDHQAAMAYPLLRERGIEPDRDVRIVSCGNNEPWLFSMSPRPATIDPGTVQQGHEVIHRLAYRIEHPHAEPVTIYVTPRLVPPQPPIRHAVQ